MVYPSLMRKMYIDGGKELVRLLKAVHEQGVAISVDMAMFEESTEGRYPGLERSSGNL